MNWSILNFKSAESHSEGEETNSDHVRILLVEDRAADAALFKKLLSRAIDGDRYETHLVTRLADALQFLKENPVDVIVADLSLPDSIGLETVESIHSAFPLHTLVVLTGLKDEDAGIHAIQKGAQDFLVKGSFTARELTLALRYAMKRQSALSQIKLEKSVSQFSAEKDSVTGLPNHKLFDDRLDRALALARREKKLVGVLYLEISNLSDANNRFGRAIGDLALKCVAERFTKSVRESDTVARLKEDQFGFILYDLKNPLDAGSISKTILSIFKDSILIQSAKITFSASVGISVYPVDGESAKDILSHAGSAMYHSKELGQNHIRFHASKLNVEQNSISKQAVKLIEGFEKGEMEVFYQPLIELHSGNVIAVQAVLRWNSPEWGQLLPRDFIALAESSGLIVNLNEWLLHEACKQLNQWKEIGAPPLKLILNLSQVEMQKIQLVDAIRVTTKHHHVDPSSCCFEIKESDVTGNHEARSFLETLHTAGFQLILDSFGAGNSSIGLLSSLPLRAVKIDHSLISALKSSQSALGMIRALVEIAHGLGLESIAEGVETPMQVEVLKEMRCQFAQGFYFGRPQEANNLEPYILGKKKGAAHEN